MAHTLLSFEMSRSACQTPTFSEQRKAQNKDNQNTLEVIQNRAKLAYCCWLWSGDPRMVYRLAFPWLCDSRRLQVLLFQHLLKSPLSTKLMPVFSHTQFLLSVHTRKANFPSPFLRMKRMVGAVTCGSQDACLVSPHHVP